MSRYTTCRIHLCQDNRANEVVVDCTAAGLLSRYKCVANKANGIVVADPTQPTVAENECCNNGGAGMAYGGMTGGIARGNKCLNNEEIGMLLLGDSAYPQLGQNDCRENKNAQQLRLHDHELE